jgi:hypothetical protein
MVCEKGVDMERKEDPGSHIQSPKRDYRTTAIVISAVSVIVILTQAIYSGYFNRRWKEIEYLNSQLQAQRAELSNELSAPKVAVDVQTLGGPEKILECLPVIPTTVTVRHRGGGTAKGILVEVTSTREIVGFEKWDSREEFEVRKVNGEGTKLALECARLRAGAVVGLTVIAEQVTTVKTNTLVDVGRVVVENRGFPELFSSGHIAEEMLVSRQVNASKIILSSVTLDEARLRIDVAHLEEQLQAVESETLWSWIKAKISGASQALTVAFASFSILLLLLGTELRGWLQRRRDE